jgi:hypothetical protein
MAPLDEDEDGGGHAQHGDVEEQAEADQLSTVELAAVGKAVRAD